MRARPSFSLVHINDVPMVCRSACSGASVSPVSDLLSLAVAIVGPGKVA